MRKHIVAHKDPVLDGLDNLIDGEDFVVEGLQDLDGSIKGLPLKLGAVPDGLKNPLVHVRGGVALFRVFCHSAVKHRPLSRQTKVVTWSPRSRRSPRRP